MNDFTNIEDYGVIGNCRTAALVSKRGSIDWCCFPHFDSQSYFGALLDPQRGGVFSIAPCGSFESEQSYVPDTNILLTTFHSKNGVVRLKDGFTVTSEARKRDRLWPTHEILRVVECVSGEVELALRYAPRLEYGKFAADLRLRGKFGIACVHRRNLLLLHTDLPEAAIVFHQNEQECEARARFWLRAGARLQFSLTFSDEAPAVVPSLGFEGLERMEESEAYWRSWISKCTYGGPYQDKVRRSALALKLLTFAPSGAIVAAPTSSLPEIVGGVRNWDYRYCWLRDAAFTVRALVSLGFHDEASAFLSWMLHSTRLTKPFLQVVYSVYGETRLRERELSWLRGYRDSGPVRVGNGAAEQFQLDIYGEVMSSVSQGLGAGLVLDGVEQKFVVRLGEAVCEIWRRPDEGIWEVRSGRAHHTHSKVMAWVALKRLVHMMRRYKWKGPLGLFERELAALERAIEEHGYSSAIGSYVRTFDSTELDASILVLPLFGYCEAASARMRPTREAILAGLGDRGLLYRYRSGGDGLPEGEGSFGICNFWLIENFARAGELARARRAFEDLVRRDNHVGLWSEELDPADGRFLGNYPQGFSHVGLINAAVTLEKLEKKKECLI